HIYKIGRVELSSFYIPPNLSQVSKISTASKEQYSEELEIEWIDVFHEQNVVYITGGPGYGKSLLTKKIIDGYAELRLLNAKDKLLIYSDLKQFDIKSDPSVINFLYNQMKICVGFNDDEVSRDMIDYYLVKGDCII